MKDDMLKNEIWKDIENYEGIYQVSNYGRIKSLKRFIKGRWGKIKIEEKILKYGEDKDGYYLVTLCKNGKQKTLKVHRIVANAFLLKKNNKNIINHKDENKKNNCIDNLEWCDNKYNTNYGNSISKRIKKTKKKVSRYDSKGIYIDSYESVSIANKKFNTTHISEACSGKLKTVRGFIWKYE